MFFDNLMGASTLFQLVFALYILSVILFGTGFFVRGRTFRTISLILFFGAFAANTVLMVARWIEADRPPFKTLYETMIFYPWCVSFVFFILYALYRLQILGIFCAAVNLIGFGYACAKPDVEIMNMPPALQSGWFVPHVIIYFVAYAALFASFVLAILFLALPQWRREETKEGFETYYTRAVDFGFCALTLGLVMGAIWGKVAWGDYWSWDPKENWALITWLIYLAAIHLRFISGWRGQRAAVVCAVGFAAVIFTYLGMNLLPSAMGSLHVYQ